MKKLSFVIIVLIALSTFSFTRTQQGENVEFICLKKHMATNVCHYNFKVDGAKYRYVDIGCKFKKRDEVIEKVKSGELALAMDWKIACPEPKPKKKGEDF